jgi:hypothetical protein
MKVLTNKGARRLGVPGRPAIILNANESVPISDSQLENIQKSSTAVRWLESGVLLITDGEPGPEIEPKPPSKAKPGVRRTSNRDKREKVVLPDGVTGEGTECHHKGGGWWEVYVNGFRVTDRNVRKDEAETIAAEYDE